MKRPNRVRILTRTSDEDGHVPINLVPKLLHESIQSVTVLFDDVIGFRENVFSKSLPCDNTM
jgi:hypothetical protein